MADITLAPIYLTVADQTTAALAALAAVWPDVEFDTYNDGIVFAAVTDRGDNEDGGNDPHLELVWEPGDKEDPAVCWGVLDHTDSCVRLGTAVEAMRAAMLYEAGILETDADDPDVKLGYQREDAAMLRRLAKVPDAT